jgi:hypothetical protein
MEPSDPDCTSCFIVKERSVRLSRIACDWMFSHREKVIPIGITVSREKGGFNREPRVLSEM